MDSRKITDPLNRGMVGGLLGMPADMLNMLRNGGRSIGNLANRLAGVNAPPATMVENPVYGQEWWGDKMQKAGYVSPNRNKLAEFGAGLLDPGSVMTDVPMLAKGLFGLGDPALQTVTKGLLAKRAYDVAPDVARTAAKNLSAPATLNKPGFAGQRGAVVWHGSPHAFDAFDSSKIGTGEGAQAYGHGLYLAESPDVAKSYQTALTHSDDYVDGQLLDSTNPVHLLARVLSDESGNVFTAKDSLEMFARPGGSKSVAESAKQALKLLENGQRPALQTIKPEGSIYKVDLPDEKIARMLDWDAPLSKQSPEVRAAFESRIAPMRKEYAKPAPGWGDLADGIAYDPTGRELMELLRDRTGSTAQDFLGNGLGPQVSQQLRQAGIPGIRYLDGGSRGAGAGSWNFVVFPGEESALKILERNGQPLK